MAYKIVVKPAYTASVLNVLKYLQEEWSYKVATEFLQRLDNKIAKIALHPDTGKSSEKVRMCVV